mmetsp:Transcript_18922/g.48541  ORF Transcript_18922/g.48541 Transcript_18922/m.48541 type:complete len:230 (+) Transcript_18922:229-918(+)
MLYKTSSSVRGAHYGASSGSFLGALLLSCRLASQFLRGIRVALPQRCAQRLAVLDLHVDLPAPLALLDHLPQPARGVEEQVPLADNAHGPEPRRQAQGPRLHVVEALDHEQKAGLEPAGTHGRRRGTLSADLAAHRCLEGVQELVMHRHLRGASALGGAPQLGAQHRQRAGGDVPRAVGAARGAEDGHEGRAGLLLRLRNSAVRRQGHDLWPRPCREAPPHRHHQGTGI